MRLHVKVPVLSLQSTAIPAMSSIALNRVTIARGQTVPNAQGQGGGGHDLDS